MENLQFIVTDFLILHAGRQSLFRFQINKSVKTLGLNLQSPRPHPSIAALKGMGPKYHVVALHVFNLLEKI